MYSVPSETDLFRKVECGDSDVIRMAVLCFAAENSYIFLFFIFTLHEDENLKKM